MDNKEGPRFKAVDDVIISEYKNIIPDGYALSWSDENIVIKKS